MGRLNSCVEKARSLENLLGVQNQCGTKHAVASRPQAFTKTVLQFFYGMLSIFLPPTSMITRLYMSRGGLVTAFCSQVGQEKVLHMYCSC